MRSKADSGDDISGIINSIEPDLCAALARHSALPLPAVSQELLFDGLIHDRIDLT